MRSFGRMKFQSRGVVETLVRGDPLDLLALAVPVALVAYVVLLGVLERLGWLVREDSQARLADVVPVGGMVALALVVQLVPQALRVRRACQAHRDRLVQMVPQVPPVVRNAHLKIPTVRS
jgi:hypothetical protein